MKNSINIFLILISLYGCSNNLNKSSNKDTQIQVSHQEPETSLEFLNKWVRKNVDVMSVEIVGDTLKLISADFYFYYPFGKHDNINSLQSKYPILKLQTEVDTTQGEPINLYRMTSNKNFIKFVKSDDTKRIEIIYGKLLDDSVVLLRGAKIGLSKEIFLKELFIKPVHLEKINNVKIISALDGINHNYHFTGDTISSIVIDTDFMFNKL